MILTLWKDLDRAQQLWVTPSTEEDHPNRLRVSDDVGQMATDHPMHKIVATILKSHLQGLQVEEDGTDKENDLRNEIHRRQ